MTDADARALGLATSTVTLLVVGAGDPSDQRAVRGVIARHRGTSCTNSSGVHDVLVGWFQDGSDAVDAAVVLGPTMSVALHRGEVVLLPDGVGGTVVDRAADLAAIGSSGAVLVSESAAEHLAGRLPAALCIVERGVHRLSDLGRPERVWQLLEVDASAEPAPLRSLSSFPNNLPTQLTPFIGRHGEIDAVVELLAAARLVTVTGAGGVGKTRFALSVAARAPQSFRGGAWNVELAPVAVGGDVGRAVLGALRVGERSGVAIEVQVATALGDGPSLLVLDNCEHLREECATLVGGLLVANESVAVLATSREPLGVPGEVTWRLPPLSTPDVDGVLPAALYEHDASRLFVERARRADPRLVIGADDVRAVVDICHRLDGIPLALELAAARCRQLGPRYISGQLDDRFRLLTGGSNLAVTHHQTLLASLEWSHERLDETERLVFRRLGVFVGPFPLEAAEAVASAPGEVDPAAVFDVLSRLVDKNLVVCEENLNAEPRYRLLETLRVYALEQADGAGELADLRDAHTRWWTDWLEPRWRTLSDETQAAAQQFHGNLVAALDWSTSDPGSGLLLLTRLVRVWTQSGRVGDAMVAVDHLMSDENAARYGTLWLTAAIETSNLMLMARGVEEAQAMSARVEHLASEQGDDYHAALMRALSMTADTPDLERARDAAREHGDRYVEAEMTVGLAFNAADADPVAAAPLLADLTELTTSGPQRLCQAARLATAMALRSTGDLRTCIELITGLLNDVSADDAIDAVNLLGVASLLARDEQALRIAMHRALHLQRTSPGVTSVADNAQHRLDLLSGGPSTVDPYIAAAQSSWRITNTTLWLVGREAIDAGAGHSAIRGVRAIARDDPHGRALVAAVTAAATGDENNWHTALHIAVEHDLRLIAVDALEGLANAAARNGNGIDCLRLMAAAQRLRDETGYQWRFRFESEVVESARRAALEAADRETSQASPRKRCSNGARPPPTRIGRGVAGSGLGTAGSA